MPAPHHTIPALWRWRSAELLAALMSLVALSGCIERRLVIVTDPPDVRVYVNGVDVGSTDAAFDAVALGLDTAPAQERQAEVASLGARVIPFAHYGSNEIVLVKPGFASQRHEIEPSTPLFEQFPLDFVFEILWPGTIQATHVFRFTLEPESEPDYDRLVEAATTFRKRAVRELAGGASAESIAASETPAVPATSASGTPTPAGGAPLSGAQPAPPQPGRAP